MAIAFEFPATWNFGIEFYLHLINWNNHQSASNKEELFSDKLLAYFYDSDWKLVFLSSGHLCLSRRLTLHQCLPLHQLNNSSQIILQRFKNTLRGLKIILNCIDSEILANKVNNVSFVQLWFCVNLPSLLNLYKVRPMWMWSLYRQAIDLQFNFGL